MEPESTPPTEQSQKAPKDTHLTIRVHKKAAISIGIIVIMLLAFVLSFDTLNKALMRTFPQLNPLSNDIPEVTVVEEEYIDVSADPNRAKRKGIEKCGTMPDIESIPSGHWDVVDGPYWILDCQHLVWNQWTSGTSWPTNGEEIVAEPIVTDGLYVRDVQTGVNYQISTFRVDIMAIQNIAFGYKINNTVSQYNLKTDLRTEPETIQIYLNVGTPDESVSQLQKSIEMYAGTDTTEVVSEVSAKEFALEHYEGLAREAAQNEQFPGSILVHTRKHTTPIILSLVDGNPDVLEYLVFQ